MDQENAPPAGVPPQSPAAGSRGPNWALLAFVVAAGALVVAGASWYQSGRAIDEVRGLERSVASNPAAGKAPVIDLAGAPVLGPATAAVAFVEFSDYECPYCIRHFRQTMPQIVARYVKTGQIRYAFRDWPVDQLHPQSIRAHEAAHCALEQDKFWDLHPRLFGPPGSHAPEQLTALASAAGLDMTAFAACIAANRSGPAIRATSQTAVDLGASGTPAFFVGAFDGATNTVRVMQGLAGAQPIEDFAKAIDDALTRARDRPGPSGR